MASPSASDAVQELWELVSGHTKHQGLASALGLKLPRGILLHGPPGTGKTMLVQQMSRDCGASLHILSSVNVHGVYAGESEQHLRKAFAAAGAAAASGRPAIILIDEIDAICPQRNARQQTEARVVAQLLTLMDGLTSGGQDGLTLVVATTNRLNAVDTALRRAGRFDREIGLQVPNEDQRAHILQMQMKLLPLAEGVEPKLVASQSWGYSFADLVALCREAAVASMRRQRQAPGTRPLVTMHDFEEALTKVGPSLLRSDIHSRRQKPVTWDDIGGLHKEKKRLQQAVEWPLRHKAAFQRLGLTPPRGILLHGPPGCCKTTLAMASAGATGVPVLSLSGAELFSMYVGEGEALLRSTFQRARLAAPCVILFDEIDAVGSSRSNHGHGSLGSPGERLVAALLSEMDGLDLAKNVLVIGATNRPSALDSALMRPGRFDVVLFVPPPDEDGRREILNILTKDMRVHPDVDLQKLAALTPLFSGAELANLCRDAVMAALRQSFSSMHVTWEHFDSTLRRMVPGLTAGMVAKYENFGQRK